MPTGCEARRRWAELLRRIYEVDPLTCPACGGAMRILPVVTGALAVRDTGHRLDGAPPNGGEGRLLTATTASTVHPAARS